MSASIVTVFAVTALILSSLGIETFAQPSQSILSESLCWFCILGAGKAYLHSSTKSLRQPKVEGLHVISFGATLLCLTYSVPGQNLFLAPFLSLVLLVINDRRHLLPDQEDAPKLGWTAAWNNRYSLQLCVYSIITAIGLSQGNSSIWLPANVCWLVAQSALYWGLSEGTIISDGNHQESITGGMQVLIALAPLMICTTTPLALLWSSNNSISPQLGLVVVLKISRWAVITILSHQSRVSIPIWSIIFTVCTNALQHEVLDWRAVIVCVASFIALYNAASTLGQSSKGKWIIVALALIPMWSLGIQNDMKWSFGLKYPSEKFFSFSTKSQHPIHTLVEIARAKFSATQDRQSRNLDDAIKEYTKRYGRRPPPGFDQWYQFTVDNDVQWIDEYDLMTKSLEPFWLLSPQALQDYIEQALAVPDTRFNTLEIKNHKASLSNGTFQHAQLVELLKPVVAYLPDLKAVLNEPDEPRVLIPHDKVSYISPTTSQSPSEHVQTIYFGSQSKQRVWETVTLSCAPESLARAATLDIQSSKTWDPFVSDLGKSQDICQWPASSSRKHGFLASPGTFSFTHQQVPILSTAKLSTFHDIMIPSSYYFRSDIAEYDESKDSSWDQKSDLVYWRGTATGGYWTDGSWKFGHRQRFVNFTTTAEQDITLLKESSPNHWTPYRTKMKTILKKFSVTFSGYIQCEKKDCEDQESYFHKAAMDSNNDSHNFKILYNIDGNSFSGRYYRFLKSNSLVFMQALFKEWHDDRIIPWVHYVPISNSLEDLPEITRYLLDDPQGKVIAEKIANDSREWARKILRPVDISAAYFRLLLEYHRLLDDNRDTLA